jgi:uncharacterized protein
MGNQLVAERVARPRFYRAEKEIEATLRAVRENGVWVIPTEKVQGCFDPDDDIFLECAQAASAHYLVTGNTKHFRPDGAGRES